MIVRYRSDLSLIILVTLIGRGVYAKYARRDVQSHDVTFKDLGLGDLLSLKDVTDFSVKSMDILQAYSF